MPKIHPTAVVDPSVQLASDVVVGPWCVVGPGVTIGEGTELVSHVVIDRDTTIGRENVLHPFSVVGGPPQDKKYHGERTTLEVGDRNQIREYASLHRGTANGGGVTVVGSDNLIMGCVHVAHDCRIGSGVILANNAMVAGHVIVEDGANVGGGAGLHHFVRVGSRSFVGAMARVSKDVPPFMIVEGNPAEVRGHNAIAMRRMGLLDAEIEAMKDAYKRLFRDRGGSILAKLDALRADYRDFTSVMTLCDAVLETTGGVHGRAQESARSDDKRGVRAGTPSAPKA
jgi:UDP-N-acetylglucosamine acyltransferase